MRLNKAKYQTITRTHFYLTSDSGTNPLTHQNKKPENERVGQTGSDFKFLYWDDYEDYTNEE